MNPIKAPKIGQTVWHLLHGWEGRVVSIRPEDDSPLGIEEGGGVDYYALDGREFPEDVNPTWGGKPARGD